MDLMGIGEFARLSRLSPKALRLYDELGLLPPARVDLDSGYRWYACGQLDQARLVASLRQIGVPLAQITVILGLEALAAAPGPSRGRLRDGCPRRPPRHVAAAPHGHGAASR